MASQDYLIAIALIEQNLVRAMPLGGKEIKDNIEEVILATSATVEGQTTAHYIEDTIKNGKIKITN